jgi:hypothetical protein
MENDAGQQHWLQSVATQQMLCQLSDSPGQLRDPLAPLRDLMQAQREAMTGDDVYAPEYGPF